MRIALFYHSLVSDWNHGNAHFLRGVASELIRRGHEVSIYEPRNNWSRANLTRDFGVRPVHEFEAAYPDLRSREYDEQTLDLDCELDGADLVIVHEWNTHSLVKRIGEHRRTSKHYRLLFHDTHHRSVTDPQSMAAYRLETYDGVLAFGERIREIYRQRGWSNRVWTWHEAADIHRFYPIESRGKEGDLVWVGNWGDDERTAELNEFLLEPVHTLGLRAKVHGVRYPQSALDLLRRSGIQYGDWLPNYKVPETFARYRVTVHIPRRPYSLALAGIPTIRPFEAMACGIPLVSAPWDDFEGLFAAGRDYLLARTGEDMTRNLRMVLSDTSLRQELIANGLRRIRERHTCAHRVNELLDIYAGISAPQSEVVTTGIG